MRKLILLLLLISISSLANAQTGSNEDSLSKNNEDKIRAEIIKEARKSSEYKTAFIAVKEIKINVDLAKKGLLNQNDVIADYNNRLGHSMGRYKTLYSIEKRLNESGDEYIKMVLYKAAGRIGLEKASQLEN